MIYLDNAASSHPKPAEVLRAVTEHLRNNGANPGRSGHRMAMEAARSVFHARQTLSGIFGAEPENVIFTANTTDAINRGLKGLLKPGDHVLISDLEHNSVLRPLASLQKRGIVSYTVVSTGVNDEETVARFRRCVTPKTAMIVCTHASNVSGRILPIRQIGEFCNDRGILFGVDAAQTAGVEAIHLKNDRVDFLCVPGHKSLLGPQGTGALILRSGLSPIPLTEGGTGYDSLSEDQPDTVPEGQESGTLNTPGIAGFEAGARFADAHREIIRRHERNLRDLFAEEITKIPGFILLNTGERFVGTVSFYHENAHSEEIAQWLDLCGICVRGGYHCSALAHRTLGTLSSGAVRVSFGYRNTEQDAVECIKCLKKYQNNSRKP